MHGKRFYGIAVIIALASLALISSQIRIYYIPIISLIGIAIFTIYKRRFSSRADIIGNEADMLIDAMIINYQRYKNPIELLSMSLKREWRVYGTINPAISAYKASSNPDVFKRLLKSESMKIRLIGLMISRSIVDNSHFYEDLTGLADLFIKRNGYRMRSYGIVKNGLFVVNMGTILFFPIFAGIGLNIINFAGTRVNTAYSTWVSASVILYLLFVSLINSRYSDDNIYDKLAFASLTIFISLTVFRASSFISAFMLR